MAPTEAVDETCRKTGVCQEDLDETSATHHEPCTAVVPSTTNGGDNVDDLSSNNSGSGMHDNDDNDLEAAVAAVRRASEKSDTNVRDSDGRSASIVMNQRVAAYAMMTYQRAASKSSILKAAHLNDVAMVKFEELELGKFLGNGSFSDVQ